MAKAEQYSDLGYIKTENVLNQDEVAHLKKTMIASLGGDAERGEKKYIADGVNQDPELWDLLFNKSLLQGVREALGEEDIRWGQHTDLHINVASTGMHRDSVYRTFGKGPDWDTSEPYKVVRVAIYLVSSDENNAALIVEPKTQRQEKGASRQEIRTNAGDVVFFDPRIRHMATKITKNKYSIFTAFGANNFHTQNHRAYYLHHRHDHGYQDIHPDLEARLREAGLFIECDPLKDTNGAFIPKGKVVI